MSPATVIRLGSSFSGCPGGCALCSYEREIADKLFEGVPIGCFPDLYGALDGNMPNQIITL
jgi:hypothetical protein